MPEVSQYTLDSLKKLEQRDQEDAARAQASAAPTLESLAKEIAELKDEVHILRAIIDIHNQVNVTQAQINQEVIKKLRLFGIII